MALAPAAANRRQGSRAARGDAGPVLAVAVRGAVVAARRVPEGAADARAGARHGDQGEPLAHDTARRHARGLSLRRLRLHRLGAGARCEARRRPRRVVGGARRRAAERPRPLRVRARVLADRRPLDGRLRVAIAALRPHVAARRVAAHEAIAGGAVAGAAAVFGGERGADRAGVPDGLRPGHPGGRRAAHWLQARSHRPGARRHAHVPGRAGPHALRRAAGEAGTGRRACAGSVPAAIRLDHPCAPRPLSDPPGRVLRDRDPAEERHDAGDVHRRRLHRRLVEGRPRPWPVDS